MMGEYQKRGLWLDPRTKILLLLICVLSAMFAPSLQYEFVFVVVIGLLGVICVRWKYALKGILFYALVYLFTI